jgi:hypothetical protein
MDNLDATDLLSFIDSDANATLASAFHQLDDAGGDITLNQSTNDV